MVEISKNILQKAAEISAQKKERHAQRNRKSAATRRSREREETQSRTEALMSGLVGRILKEAEKGRNRLVVVGLIADRIKRETPSFADPAEFFYDLDNKVDRAVYGQVFEECQHRGLNPKERIIDRSYGEDVFPPVHFIVIDW